ncbi:hypothetical protein FRC08_016433 [Ceratobasidium sp. 394]|nr:hypothetical protein FRC08_016433 [Ceratobasidium sp. 394]
MEDAMVSVGGRPSWKKRTGLELPARTLAPCLTSYRPRLSEVIVSSKPEVEPWRINLPDFGLSTFSWIMRGICQLGEAILTLIDHVAWTHGCWNGKRRALFGSDATT